MVLVGRRALLAGVLALTAAGCAEPRVLTRASLMVAQDGSAEYSTIQAAVNAAREGDTILVQPGTYREQVSAWGINDLHIRGTDRDRCILTGSSGDYSTPPLEIGSGSVRNMTIIEDHADAGTELDIESGDQRAYSIHADNYFSMLERTLTIEDCTIINTRRAALGCGLYQGSTVTVRNCDIRAGVPQLAGDRRRGAIYFHNCLSETNVITDQHVILDGNTIECDEAPVFYLYDVSAAEGAKRSVMDVLCVDNTFRSAGKGARLGGSGFTRNVTLHPDSRGNNVSAINA